MAEVAAIAEHVSSLAAAAAAFRVTPDVGVAGDHATAFVPPVEDGGDDETAALLREIREWAGVSLGTDHTPTIWLALAHDPRLAGATWRKDRVILSAGLLDERAKGCVALAVAQARQNEYWIAYFTQYLRTRWNVGAPELVEIAGTVMHYVAFNTIAHAMRLDAPCSGLSAADVAPGGRLEHMVPVGHLSTRPRTPDEGA